VAERLTAVDLDVLRLGEGPPVVLVHGSIVEARRTWRHQLVLAEHWSLCVPNRPGFGGSPPLERGDFEAEAPLIAELLGDGAHLVGHSYGAVIALLAAAQRPEAVRSLTVSEPGSLRVAVHRLRKDYKTTLREAIAETVERDEDVDDELRYLLKVVMSLSV
jgi:pimeloyl-ACP methyl ester carboxylesterase